MDEFNTLDDFNLENKTVLLRVDINMPLDKNSYKILDETRIKLVVPTIKEIIKKNAKVVILAHQGRHGSWDFISLDQHAKTLEKNLNHEVKFINDIFGEKAKNAIINLESGDIILLDNVRKIEYETEIKSVEEHSKTEFIQSLYPLADLFVNDAFAAAHRAHCSLIGFTNLLPSCAGRLMEKELRTLKKVLKNPEKPCVFLFGGAKFSDVVITIENVLKNNIADKVILAGLPANAFLKSNGFNLGKKNEYILLKEGNEKLFSDIKNVYSMFKKKIYLPMDFAISDNDSRREIILKELPTEHNLFDIGKITIENFKEHLKSAKTVFLSGPCGVFENIKFRKGTEEIFRFVADSEIFSIVGGGHTVAAVEQMKIRDKISHVSTGGGSLEKIMMGEKLVVVESLKNAKNNKFVFNS